MARTAKKPLAPADAPEILPAKAVSIVLSQEALAEAKTQTEARTRAVAHQLGYTLPVDCVDADLIQRDIAANMRRSVEACLEVGRGIRVLKEACSGHSEFLSRLEDLGIDYGVAQKFIQAASKFSTSRTLTNAAGGQSKLFEMLVLDDEQIKELELTGQTGELALDDVATMSVKELRAALRKERGDAKAEQAAVEKRLQVVSKQRDDAEARAARIAVESPDEELAELQKASVSVMNDALGAVRGSMRNALIALQNHAEDNGVFMAGLVGQLQADLQALREEFNLPDTSSAALAQLAAETAQWANA